MLNLSLLPGSFAVCRLESDAPVPGWVPKAGFVSLTRTDDELSIVCDESAVPDDLRVERGWRALKVKGPLDFSLIGVLASLAGALAEADVSVFAVSTFDTDYLLVRQVQLDRAVAALKAAGHSLR
jgi:hypothetical protein